MPLVPVNGPETLCYGSSDAGNSITSKFAAVDRWMSLAAEQLCLAAHPVDDLIMYTGGDVEVHLGLDNNFYLLDVARVFPPEDPHLYQRFHEVPFLNTNSVFYRMLRPEILRLWAEFAGKQYVVSSDSFSRWGEQDAEIHNKVSNTCSFFLFVHQIPLVVAELEASTRDQVQKDVSLRTRLTRLTTILHKN
jgi:hypothetical protein